MIQSDIFDSSSMDIRKIGNPVLIFITKRLIEISGIIILVLGILLFISLISYSPSDPNFIFPENFEINNYLGFYTKNWFYGSYSRPISDIVKPIALIINIILIFLFILGLLIGIYILFECFDNSSII